jgi:predicted dehydrogenase
MSSVGVMTRRGFLKRAGAAAAVVAAPAVIPASVLGAGGTPPPSSRVTMGFIGIGKMGEGHLRGLARNAQVEILGIAEVYTKFREMAVDVVNEASKARGGEGKGCKSYNDFRELLARTDIDAVLIATPDHWHAIPVIEAVRSGKDIYCEKPMSLTIREARAMANAVRTYGRVFQTGSQQRSSPEFRQACELVRNGYIGDLQTINVSVGGPSRDCDLPAQPVPEGLDWDMWLGPAPVRPFNEILRPPHNEHFPNWRSFREFSGGGMTDWGAHHFDIAQWGMGMDECGPVEIIPPDGKDVKMLTYKYASGVTMYHGGGANGVLFTGTKGKVEVNRGYIKTWPENLLQAKMGPCDVRLYQSPGHHQDFFNCIRNRTRPICDVEIGCRSVTVCHLGNIAYWLGRPLKWDPAREQILGDGEAARMLDRPKRAPWHL